MDKPRLFQDVTIEMYPHVATYYNLWNQGKLTEANQLLDEYPQLKTMIINAETQQYVWDMCLSVERLFTEDIDTFILNLVQDKGDWLPSVKYVKYNTVRYMGLVFMASKIEVPIGTLPTNSNYYLPLAIKGDQGVSGAGLTPRGSWIPELQYYTYDLVVYENKLFYALRDNYGKIPSSASSSNDWLLYLQLSIMSGSTNNDTNTTVSIDGVIDVRLNPKQTFDFENMSRFTGCIINTTSNGLYNLETITIKDTGKKVATRKTTRSGQIYTETITVYEQDGITLMRSYDVKTEHLSNGSFRETINEIYPPPPRSLLAMTGKFRVGEYNVGQTSENLRGQENKTNAVQSGGTVWVDNVTPVNADNMNKIEGKLTELDNTKVTEGDIHLIAEEF